MSAFEGSADISQSVPNSRDTQVGALGCWLAAQRERRQGRRGRRFEALLRSLLGTKLTSRHVRSDVGFRGYGGKRPVRPFSGGSAIARSNSLLACNPVTMNTQTRLR